MITHECHETVLEVFLDTGKGNLLAECHLEELCELAAQAGADHGIHGIIITGTGQSFSTGLDLSSGQPAAAENPWHTAFEALDRLLVILFRFPKPFVAAINGHSVGTGFLIQLCADQVIVTDNPRLKMGLPELSLGLTIDAVMTHLARCGVAGDRMLQRLLYSGELFGSEKALQIGVADEVVTGETLIAAARGRVAHLLRGTLSAFSQTKQTLRSDTIRRMEDALAAHSHTVFDDLMRQRKPVATT